MAETLKPDQLDAIEARLARITDPSLVPMARRMLIEEAMESPAARIARMKSTAAAVRKLQEEIAAMPIRDPRTTREIQDELNQDILDSHR